MSGQSKEDKNLDNPRNVPGEKIYVSPSGVPFEFLFSNGEYVHLKHLKEGWKYVIPCKEFAEKWRNG